MTAVSKSSWWLADVFVKPMLGEAFLNNTVHQA